MNSRHFSLLCLILLALVPIGCAPSASTVLGSAPGKAPLVSAEHITLAKQTETVTVQGEMIEKCPVAGCWFKLRDKTGVVRVDTKSAGFVVSDVPLHTQMTVQGKIGPGSEAGIVATGVRF